MYPGFPDRGYVLYDDALLVHSVDYWCCIRRSPNQPWRNGRVVKRERLRSVRCNAYKNLVIYYCFLH